MSNSIEYKIESALQDIADQLRQINKNLYCISADGDRYSIAGSLALQTNIMYDISDSLESEKDKHPFDYGHETLSEEDQKDFCDHIFRCETFVNRDTEHAYIKALTLALRYCGYDPEYCRTSLRDALYNKIEEVHQHKSK